MIDFKCRCLKTNGEHKILFYVHDPVFGFKTRCIGTSLKFVIIPKRCHITGRILWLETVYEQVAMWTGPGEPIFEYRYYDKNTFLVERMKDNV